MSGLFKNACVSLVIGTFLIWFSDCLGSTFFFYFLEENLIMLLIALLAVNIATLSIIASNLKEISTTPVISFSGSISEMKKSIAEQIVIIFIAVFSQIMLSSEILRGLHCFSSFEFILRIAPASVLIYAIAILWDTSKAIFSIVE